MKFSYVLPGPNYSDLSADLAALKQAGYDAAELQITDPAEVNETRLRQMLGSAGLPLAAVQTGGSYGTRGNCLASPHRAVRNRTVVLMRDFVDFAAGFGCILVFGSLQGRLVDEPARDAGEARICDALREIATYASGKGVTVAFEPVNQLEVGFHNKIADVARVVRQIAQPGLRMMIDSYHMNIEERRNFDMLPTIADIVSHVHFSETNRELPGTGHWPTSEFFDALNGIGYSGYCSVGVYNGRLPRRQCIEECARALGVGR